VDSWYPKKWGDIDLNIYMQRNEYNGLFLQDVHEEKLTFLPIKNQTLALGPVIGVYFFLKGGPYKKI
jgi:hypothetical protein